MNVFIAARVAALLGISLPSATGAGPGADASMRGAAPTEAAEVPRHRKAPVDLVWMVGPPSDAAPKGPAPDNTAALRKRGVALFKRNCASCHGTWGDGRGPAAATLTVPTPDFTKGIFKLRSTPSGTLPTPADLYVTISRGMHGTEMFPWARFSEDERWALVYRIMSFSPRFRSEEPGKPFGMPAETPPVTEALVAKGQSLYARHRCGACHGPEGGADGPAAALYQQTGTERPVRIRDFKKGQFLRGERMEDIFLTLQTGLDGTPMGPYDVLSVPELWALAAYVKSLVQQRPLIEAPAWGDRAPR